MKQSFQVHDNLINIILKTSSFIFFYGSINQ